MNTNPKYYGVMEKKTEKQSEVLRLTADLEGDYLLDEDSKSLKAVGIFYAPAGGSVHKVSRHLKQKLGSFHPEMFCVADIAAIKLLEYHSLILVCSSLGRSTWEMEQKDRWAAFLPEMRKINLNGRKVAIVGLGDHVTYPNNFVDGIGVLADVSEERGGVLIGRVPTLDYIFNDSMALRDGMFVGLPLDEDFESEKTQERIERWYKGILPELG